MRSIFLLLSFFMFSLLAIAQQPDFKKKIKTIDSLLFYSNYEVADAKNEITLNLLRKSYTGNQYNELEIQLLLRKANIYYRTGQFSRAGKLALDVIDNSRKYNFPNLEYKACLIAAVTYEQAYHDDLCKKQMDQAYTLYKHNKLDSLFSTYCVRISSFYRVTKKKDSAVYFAYKGMYYAKRYSNKRDLTDTYLLLTILLGEDDPKKAIQFGLLAIKDFFERNEFSAVASMYHNISGIYFKSKDYNNAFHYNNLAFRAERKYKLGDDNHALTLKMRYQLFEATNNKDSAFYYLKKYHDAIINSIISREATDVKKITEQYENDKKEATIQSKNQQMWLISGLLAVIVVASVLLIRKNRQVNSQNKIINSQLGELTKTLGQKQVLLSELQHRVKNNLQHVISILEIQKESIDFNNIDELIRGNQNRIHSMALLHKKLNVSDHVNDVDLNRYLTELAELVKESYDNYKRQISLNILCGIETITLEKAFPIGLIIVELVSNSMKHAFKKRSVGIITVELKVQEKGIRLYYADNGNGFDFNATSGKGLGVEIIKGLIDQLDGTVEVTNNNGFAIEIDFNQ